MGPSHILRSVLMQATQASHYWFSLRASKQVKDMYKSLRNIVQAIEGVVSTACR
jgi:hypothetical protein